MRDFDGLLGAEQPVALAHVGQAHAQARGQAGEAGLVGVFDAQGGGCGIGYQAQVQRPGLRGLVVLLGGFILGLDE